MSGGRAITLPWGDGEYTFRLTIGGWRSIQDKCGAGPEEIAARLSPTVEGLARGLSIGEAAITGLIGRWRLDDVREPIYQGLLGGENPPGVVAKLLAETIDTRPLIEAVPLAFAIVMASVQGVPEDPLAMAAEEAATIRTSSPEAKSASASSMEEAAAPVTRRRKSTK